MTQPKTVASFRKFKLWRRNPTDSWLVCHGEYDTSQLGHAETIHVIEYGAVEALKLENTELKAMRDLSAIMRDQSETHGRIALSQCHEKKQTQRFEIEALTQRNQELVLALKEAAEVIQQQGNYFNEQGQPAIAILLHAKSSQYENVLSMDREK